MAFDPKITLGNWITIGTLIAAIIVSYSKLATRQELQESIAEVKKEYVSREVQKLEIQLVANQVKAIGEKLEEVRNDVKDIKRVVR